MHTYDEAAVLCGIGGSLPPAIRTNADLTGRLDTTDEWIRSRSGIAERRIAGEDYSTEDLAVRAAEHALACTPGISVGALVLATTTPDRVCPALAPTVAARLGLAAIPAVDISAGCSGFLYGLGLASALLTSPTLTPRAAAVLVIGAERLATLPDPTDRRTVPLFGDGAGAAVLRRGPGTEAGALGPVLLGSDGDHGDLIHAERPGGLVMKGTEVFQHAVDRMTSAATAAATAVGWTLDSIDVLAAHQANARILRFTGRRLGLAEDQLLSNIEKVGNTGAASIPILLTEAACQGRLNPGQRVVLTAFGSGLAWGVSTLTWPDLHPAFPTSPRTAR
jgi:3-oxoacyl-[acyl-carrier-protein] synthase-3